MESRTTLVELPSGKIELVLVGGVYPVLQFNLPCSAALPYCQAACCRMRSGVNAILHPDEIEKFQSKRLPGPQELYVLASNPADDSCVYLEDSKCTIQNTKPKSCTEWHCSPAGNLGDPTVKIRDMGWFLSPMGALLRPAVDVRTQNG